MYRNRYTSVCIDTFFQRRHVKMFWNSFGITIHLTKSFINVIEGRDIFIRYNLIMGRWITILSSDTVSLSDIVLAPSNSLVQLAKDASVHPEFTPTFNKLTTNGDGFGIGWYYDTDNGTDNPHHDPDPRVSSAIFKDTLPAWNDVNLREICMATRSNCVMAHVRSASDGMEVTHANCHPFKCGRLLFCHNGRIHKYSKIKRRLIHQVSEEMYSIIRGTTDSECIFGLILTQLAKDGSGGSPRTQTKAFGHMRLVSAIKKTLCQIDCLLRQAGILEGHSTFNFSLADGDTVVATRFCDKSPDSPPPSLYFSYGTAEHLYRELTSEDPVLYGQQIYNGEDESDEKGGSAESDSSSTASSSTSSNNTQNSYNVEGTSVKRIHLHEDRKGLTDAHFLETTVDLGNLLSLPGTSYANVEPLAASFVVASNPLTKTHTWHAMPKNSVMWCTRGFPPELRLLVQNGRRQESSM